MIIKQISPDAFITSGTRTAWDYLKQGLINKDHEIIKKGNNYDIAYAPVIDPISYLKLKRIKSKPRIIFVTTTPSDLKDVCFFFDLFYNLIVKYLKKIYSLADRVITISEFAKECIIKTGINKKIDVVSCGVNLEKFKYSKKKRDKFRNGYGIKKDETLIINVGTLIWRKGIDTFIKLAREFPEVKFIWVGSEFPFKKNWLKIMRLVKQKPKNLFFTGYINDIVSAYCGADIFLCPTRAENEGLPILEAGACKRPIIATNIPPIKEKISNGKNGFLCNDYNNFIKRINQLINSKSLRKKLGLNAYKMAKKYDCERTTNKIIKIFEEYK